MSLFRRYAGGLAGLVTMLALVACGAGPGSPKVDPVGFKNIELKQGSTSEISLVNTFSGSELTYKATSNKPAVATVTVDNDKPALTVTAVGPGTATITVTATNSKGSAPQSFTVTVVKPTPVGPPGVDPPTPTPTPDPDPTDPAPAPTVKGDAPDEVEFDAGDTVETVDLDDVFDNADDLEFSETSDDATVATANISGTTLTITAVGPGEATITIVATNDAGDAEHEITVTVTAPATTPPTTPTPTTSGTLTIELGESAKLTLAVGQTLQEPASGGVTVERSPDGETGNVWLITAHKKGDHSVTIFSGGATPERVRSIVVKVPNSRPVRIHGVGNPAKVLVAADIDLTANPYQTVRANLDLYSFFDDPDKEKLYFRVGNKPSWVLIDAKGGFVNTTDPVDNPETLQATDLKFEVLEDPAKKIPPVTEFDISIYAVDDSGSASSRPVKITFPTASMEPRERLYNVYQASNGNLGTLKVGPRLGADHDVIFISGEERDGFVFVNNWIKDVLLKRWSTYLTVANQGESAGTTTDPTETGAALIGVRAFDINSSDGIVAKWDADAPNLSADPKVTLKLEKARSGWIDIKYTVWRSSKKVVNDAYPSDAEPTPVSTTKRLSVMVVTCSSPPNPLTDCPGLPVP